MEHLTCALVRLSFATIHSTAENSMEPVQRFVASQVSCMIVFVLSEALNLHHSL
ncbi:hypothetical protein HanRHA438_Chr12g0568891 [Helianthus annuus]|uniref:Uncharacterized protein n=1 Tax=Helianthus annuus TaxID=4232 RepID=A0A251T4F6_HELAN|nr:hypothetical protein HanXRQr2_Chr12g0557521 [Helianthus annuus]KAJ0490568.1 hypothetical protein HanHA300_Chr12g0456971 [Helianthus annuus]KAJ0494821.1 hypothetical protein HanIR_Chr12g0601801 [Helianthus annuus]KAJ0506487.1 hypothetical protein HanHA89_Chr12g0482551 [Helianthus annuus]KAJ0676165.1 hypothetical protein HanLR1_Chr12g0459561 [Helianthus annuus]